MEVRSLFMGSYHLSFLTNRRSVHQSIYFLVTINKHAALQLKPCIELWSFEPERLIRHIKNNVSAGSDGIEATPLKYIANEIRSVLSCIMNSMLETGIFPTLVNFQGLLQPIRYKRALCPKLYADICTPNNF